MDKKPREERPFEKGKEIEIQVDRLATLDSIIRPVAHELFFKNCYFEVRSANSMRTDSFALFDVFIIDSTTKSKIRVGAFTLQWLGSNRAKLIVPSPKRWTWNHLSAEEKIKIGLIKHERKRMGLSESQYDEHFNQFIKSLEDRLTHYGLKVTLPKRLWRGFKELIGILKAVKP